MRRFVVLGILIFLMSLSPVLGVSAQIDDSASVEITTPTDGAALQGIVPIHGDTTTVGFVAFELTFGYASDSTGTWFLIAEGSEPISSNRITEWDTTTLTDGQYNLRLTVFFDDGTRTHFIVSDVRLRNYTPIETDTPVVSLTPTSGGVLSAATATPTPAHTATASQVPPAATPLPANPVEISMQALNNSLLRGAAGALALFLIVGLYVSFLRILRRK